ncbi:LOW QUALITY PROTEIN: hypothetical protein RJ639_026766 [Escallonia herrerae]|uniref:Cytochrome P450 n=1 Tax=Escallonia herrerae TaxID=1293975 RepID=A0AA88X6D3_9ASTE|nr:LOW QUALITY PROTEIN: hypothetical protein RJ639_026766 [Escallonia herrerae]
MLWDTPEKFQPERFLGKEIDMKGQNFELLPFGSGRRMCSGYTLALKTVRSSLANILHGFNWKLPDDGRFEHGGNLWLAYALKVLTCCPRGASTPSSYKQKQPQLSNAALILRQAKDRENEQTEEKEYQDQEDDTNPEAA